MNRQLPTWLSRLAAIALLVVVVLAIYTLGILPLLRSHDDIDAQIADAQRLLANYERVARSAPELQAQRDEIVERQAASGIYLRGDTDALAAAELQQRINAVIEASGGALTSTQALPVTEEGGFRRVVVRVQFTGTIEAAHRVIYELESEKPLLLIDNVDVRSRVTRRRADMEEENPALVVRFELYGYLRPSLG